MRSLHALRVSDTEEPVITAIPRLPENQTTKWWISMGDQLLVTTATEQTDDIQLSRIIRTHTTGEGALCWLGEVFWGKRCTIAPRHLR